MLLYGHTYLPQLTMFNYKRYTPNIKRKALSIGVAAFLIVISILAITNITNDEALAKEPNCISVHTLSKVELEYCLSHLETGISLRQDEYNEKAAVLSEFREMVQAGEADLSTLHAETNADRIRIRIINRRIQSFRKGE